LKKKLEEVYSQYRTQIDAIASLQGMKLRKAARMVAWFYGGSEEGWRKLLAAKMSTKKVPKEVIDFLGQIKGSE
jgi:hypothetical protein